MRHTVISASVAVLMLSTTASAEPHPMRVPKGTYPLDSVNAAVDADGKLVKRVPAHCLERGTGALDGWAGTAASDADLKMLGECLIGLPDASDVFAAASNLQYVVRSDDSATARPLAEAIADGSVEIVGDGSRSLLVRFEEPKPGTKVELVAEKTAIVAQDSEVARETLAVIRTTPAAQIFYDAADRMSAGLNRLPSDAPLVLRTRRRLQRLESAAISGDASAEELLRKLEEVRTSSVVGFDADRASLELGQVVSDADRDALKQAFGIEVQGEVSPALKAALTEWHEAAADAVPVYGEWMRPECRCSPALAAEATDFKQLDTAGLLAKFRETLLRACYSDGEPPVVRLLDRTIEHFRPLDATERAALRRLLGPNIAADYPEGSERFFESLAAGSELVGTDTAQRLARMTVYRTAGDIADFPAAYAREAATYLSEITGTSRRDLDVIELLRGEPLDNYEVFGLNQLAKLAGETDLSRSGTLGNRVLIRVDDYGLAKAHRLGKPTVVADDGDGTLVELIKALPADAEIVGDAKRPLIEAMREAGRVVMRDVNAFLAEPVRVPRPVRVLFVASRDEGIARTLYPGQSARAVVNAADKFAAACGDRQLVSTAADLHAALAQARAEGRTAIVMFDHQQAEGISFGRAADGETEEIVRFDKLPDHVVPLACDFVRPGDFGDVTTDKLYLGAMAGAWQDVLAKLDLEKPVDLDRVLGTFSAGYERHLALDVEEANRRVIHVFVVTARAIAEGGTMVGVAAQAFNLASDEGEPERDEARSTK